MSRQKYNELYAIGSKFPFLLPTITKTLLNSYDIDEFDDFETLLKEYDYTTDIYSQSKPYTNGWYGGDFTLDFKNKEDNVLMHILTNESTYSELIRRKKYLTIFRMLDRITHSYGVAYKNIEYMNINSMTDEQRTTKKIIEKFLYIFGQTFNSYLNDTYTDKDKLTQYTFTKDLLDNKLDNIRNILALYYSDSPIKSLSLYYNGANEITIGLNRVIGKIFDFETPENAKLFIDKCKEYSVIFDTFGVRYYREITLFNNNLNTDNRQELLKKYTTADSLKNLAKELCSSFVTYGFDSDKLSNIIDIVILNNKKIRDSSFPVTKDRVVHEFFKYIFMNNDDTDSRQFTENGNSIHFNKFVEKYHQYIFDPYFITSIMLKESYINNNYTKLVKKSSNFISAIFNIKEFNYAYRKELLDRYFEELSKDETARKSTVKQFYESNITYGTLQYIIDDKFKPRIINKLEEDKKDDDDDNRIFDVIQYLNETPYDLAKYIFAVYFTRDDKTDNPIDYFDIRKSSIDGWDSYYNSDMTSNVGKYLYQLFSNSKITCRYSSNVGSDSLVHANEYNTFERIMRFYKLQNIVEFRKKEERTNSVLRNMSGSSDSCCRIWREEDKDDIIKTSFFALSEWLYKAIKTQIKPSNEILERIKDVLFVDTNIMFKPDNVYSMRLLGNRKYDDLRSSGSEAPDFHNYLSLDTFAIYMKIYKLSKELSIDANFSFNDDMVLIPEYPCEYKNRHTSSNISERASYYNKIVSEYVNTDYEFIKPIIKDNFTDSFSFDRSMKSILFELSSYFKNDRSSYSSPLSRFYSSTSKPEVNVVVSVQNFYNNIIFNNLRDKVLISEDDYNTINDAFNKTDLDIQCMETL